MSSEEFSMKHSSGLECQLIEWGGCPWISCKEVSGVSQVSSGELNVVRYGLQPHELHRARGHMPYDPSCKHCVAAKSVGQHRRKNQDSEGGIIMELHSDFFFIGKEKFLVVADLSSHMFGGLWMSPNSDVNHRNLSYWLKEFGCMDGNPQGVLHVYTDDEVAVGAVFQDAKLDKPVKVTRAAPQSPETNGLAEQNVACKLVDWTSKGLVPLCMSWFCTSLTCQTCMLEFMEPLRLLESFLRVANSKRL